MHRDTMFDTKALCKTQNTDANTYAESINESLLANINHAIRTPLNGLIGMMELLGQTALDNRQSEYAHTIRQSTEMLMLQLDNIVTLAKYDDGDLTCDIKTINLKKLIQNAVQTFIPSAVKSGIPIYIHYHPNTPETIEADDNKLSLIIKNILACSLKFAERGKIVLHVMYEEGEDNGIVQNTAEPRITFVIENSKTLYDAMQTILRDANAHNDQTKTDLTEFGEVTVSLQVVQSLLNIMNATLHFDMCNNNHNDKAPFRFVMPCKIPQKNVIEQQNVTEQSPHILIVQDDPSAMNMIIQSLIIWDYDYTIIDDIEFIINTHTDAHKQTRGYDILISYMDLDKSHIKEIKTHIPTIIHVSDENQLYPNILRGLIHEETKNDFDLNSQRTKTITDQIQKPHVLLVEDDFVSRMYASEMLESLGCKVSIAENGQLAIQKASGFDDYDIIFMDCMMPRLDGYNATMKIRKLSAYRNKPVIALTANTMQDDKQKCLNSGMTDYITKPVREEDLRSALHQYYREKF